MIYPSIVKPITVGVSLTATISFGADFRGENISIISPDNTPMYNIDVYAPSGAVIATGSNIGVQYALLECRYTLKGTITVVISSAADQGVYTVEFLPR